jgi:hypothetical protein
VVSTSDSSKGSWASHPERQRTMKVVCTSGSLLLHRLASSPDTFCVLSLEPHRLIRLEKIANTR